MVLPPFNLGVDHAKHSGWRSKKLERFGPVRDRCRDRVPPTGGGEATSHSAPLQGRISFYALQLHGGQAKPWRSVSDYFHHRHQERLSGAVSAVWALCSSTWSSWTSLRRASNSSPWAWTWACRVVTSTSRLLSWLFKCWSSGPNSTSHRYPWGVGSLWASSSPLPMRRRTVSVDTPKRRAASAMDTFSTAFPPLGMGKSIGVCLGSRLGAAWANSGWFWPGPRFHRGAIDHLLAAAPLYRVLSALDPQGSGGILQFRPISREITRSASLPLISREGEHPSFPPPVGPPRTAETRPAGGPAQTPSPTNRGSKRTRSYLEEVKC